MINLKEIQPNEVKLTKKYSMPLNERTFRGYTPITDMIEYKFNISLVAAHSFLYGNIEDKKVIIQSEKVFPTQNDVSKADKFFSIKELRKQGYKCAEFTKGKNLVFLFFNENEDLPLKILRVTARKSVENGKGDNDNE